MTYSCLVNALTSEGRIFTELVLELFHVNGLLLEAGDELTRPVGLSSARWQVLGALEHGPSPVANVARVMGLSRQAVQQTADALVRDGFTEYLTNPHHHRAKLVSLTPKGRDALAFTAERQAIWANALSEGHTAERLQDALTLLQQLGQSLEPSTDRSRASSLRGKERSL